ncbi:glycosyltransferase family 2 protein [Niabella hirudinis]|uniref:glycosyltransferase family 2 protein n=1 Tax=Niabella hirudinis TaxID=1285929 RepID=UPI003EBF0496
MTLSIIIVNYNVKYFAEHCLLSAQRAARNIATELIVVDNCSTDGSLEYLQPLFPRVLFIANKENTGFGRACNQGLHQSTGRFVLFLNPDTLVPEDCFSQCLQVFERHKEVGALGIRMINGQGIFLKESMRGFPSFSAAFFKLSGINRLFPRSRFFNRYYMGHLNAQKDQFTEALAGAFMLISRGVLEKTGGFDEAFFMYGEDIDLSYRVYKTGYKNYYLSSPSIIHFKGESTSKKSLAYIRNFYGAMSIFVKKHYTGFKKLGFRLLVHTGIGVHAPFKYIADLLRARQQKTTRPESSGIIIGTPASANALIPLLPAAENNSFTLLAPGDTQLIKVLREHSSVPIYICEQDLRFVELIRIVGQSRHSCLYFFSGNSIISGS